MATSALRSIESALCTATEFFAAALAMRDSGPPHWSPFEWTMAQAAAVLHGVTPLLATRLPWSGPPAWQRFVSEQFQHVRARHGRIELLLHQLHQASTASRVGFIALKGSALHERGIYLPGQRPMADIDLLVAPSDAQRMRDILGGVGYQQYRSTWKHDVFKPVADDAPAEHASTFGEHCDAPIRIELHTAVVERLPIRGYDITQRILGAPLRPGRNPYPSDPALLLHLLLHAAPSMMVRSLRLIHLHDIACIARQISAYGWSSLIQSREISHWALPPLQLASRYFPGSVPAPVLEALSPHCPRRLVRLSRTLLLSQLSYAQLSVRMLPGFVWSASPAEKLQCVWRRLRPSAEQHAVLALTRAETWARCSPLQHSYPTRMVRQLLLRPARTEAMFVVRAAAAAAKSIDG